MSGLFGIVWEGSRLGCLAHFCMLLYMFSANTSVIVISMLDQMSPQLIDNFYRSLVTITFDKTSLGSIYAQFFYLMASDTVSVATVMTDVF